MKILSKLCLIILILSSGKAHALPSFYWIAHKYFEIGRHLGIGIVPAMAVGKWAHYKNKIQTLPDAPEIIVRFCHEKFKAQGFNPEQMQIKVKEDTGFLESFGKNCIVFSPLAANNFKRALENSGDENSIRVAKIYSTFIDHELAHLKHNDTSHRLMVLGSVSAIAYLASSYVIKLSRLSSLFKEPTNKKDFFITYVAYGVTNIGTTVFMKALSGWYARHQENRADAYAIALAKDPEALRHSAKYLEKLENGMIDFLCGADLHPAISFVVKFQLNYIRSALVAQYQTLKPKEDFRAWVKQQTRLLAFMKFISDAEHPSGFSRAQTMYTAANELEAKQKVVATSVTLPVAAPAA